MPNFAAFSENIKWFLAHWILHLINAVESRLFNEIINTLKFLVIKGKDSVTEIKPKVEGKGPWNHFWKYERNMMKKTNCAAGSFLMVIYDHLSREMEPKIHISSPIGDIDASLWEGQGNFFLNLKLIEIRMISYAFCAKLAYLSYRHD